MNDNYTHVSLILDRSGSMSSNWNDTIEGVKTFIKSQKEDAEKCTFSLVFFNTEVKEPLLFVDMKSVTESSIDNLNLEPDGLTALIDAVCVTITNTGKKLADLQEADRPGKVMIVIQTDGLENASTEYTPADIIRMIKEQREKYSWDFLFMGATEESVLSSRDFGISDKSTVVYSKSKSKNTFDVVSRKTRAYRRSSKASVEFKNAIEFSDDDKIEIN